ncbi:ATP-binding protein [Streptomyces sp. HNM0645]|uniref:ATP-binding protein n=1 Tax=Streptomyces sp. HNM0645 TaxID=2782343 RepID=UPI0024B841A1|nr:ATP-binding protein [Streptomyces sp. HNM0645]MDI9888256.1 ATP-binding protein [Streptomyces sp. HNM0645]
MATQRGGSTTNEAATGHEQPSGTPRGTRAAPSPPGPGTHGHRTPPVSVAHEQGPGTAAAARERVRGLLDGHAGAPLAPRVVGDILLVTSELVTNALRHGGGIAAFHAELDGGTVRIRVTDRSPTPPSTAARRRVTTPGGFGWPLVQRLSRSVTVTPALGGKTVEVVLLLTPDGA